MPPSCASLGGFAIGARGALLWQHYRNAWQSPAVIRQAQRTPQARTHARTSDKIDAPAACATLSATRPFHFVHTARVLQRERQMLASTRSYSRSVPSCYCACSFSTETVMESFRCCRSSTSVVTRCVCVCSVVPDSAVRACVCVCVWV